VLNTTSGAAGGDLLDGLAIDRVVEGKVILADTRAAVGNDDLTDFLFIVRRR
jgi:hypothetical protein